MKEQNNTDTQGIKNMIKIDDEKATPNQLAKHILTDWVMRGMEYGMEEGVDEELENATDAERYAVQEYLKKRTRAVLKLLGTFDIYAGGSAFPND